MRFQYFLDASADDPDFVYFTVHLNKPSFFTRLWDGIRYIFGYQCKWGAFDEILLEKPQVEKLREFCDKYLEQIKG